MKESIYLLLRGWFPVRTAFGVRWRAKYRNGQGSVKTFELIKRNALNHQRRISETKKRKPKKHHVITK